MTVRKIFASSILVWLALWAAVGPAQGQVVTVTGVGPVNRGMAGAGTAAPLDAMGALNWNPGSISGMANNELSFGLELITVGIDLTSTIGGSSVTTEGEGGFTPVPSVGWVHHVDDTPWTVGLGVYAVAGFKNNQPLDPSNPLLAASPAYADAEVLQIAPTVSYAVSERLSIGVAPTVSLASITIDPLGPSIFTPVPTSSQGNRVHWGGGFQIGAYYIHNDCWRFGAAFKSRQWFETFHFNTSAGKFLLDFDYPMIVSLGTAYTGSDRWTVAADIRYLDYANTDGFDRLGFSDIFACAFGVQYEASKRLHLRGGYNFNSDPIQSADAFTNVITPLIQQHNIAVGASWRFACNVDFNAAYVYLVENELTGALPSPPFGPNDTLTHTVDAHSGILGITVRY